MIGQNIPFSLASQLWPAYYMGLALWGPNGKISASVHIQAAAMSLTVFSKPHSLFKNFVPLYKSATGRTRVNSPTAPSPGRNTQAKDSGSFSFHVCGVLTLSFYNTFRLSNVPLLQAIGLPLAAFVTLRFGRVERI